MTTKKKAPSKAVNKVSTAKKAAPVKKSASKSAPAKSAPAKGKAVAPKKATSKVASKHAPVKKNEKPASKNAVHAKVAAKANPIKSNKKETVKKEPVKKAEVKKAEVKKVEPKHVDVKKTEVKKAAAPVASKPEKPVSAKPVEVKKPEPVIAAAPPPPPPAPVKKPAPPAKPAKLVMPEIKTKSVKKYEPEFTKSVLDQPVNVQLGPTMRYSDSELTEFRELIQKKLDQAKKELAYLQGLITRKDEMGGDETENRYTTMEDGSMSMEREQLAQMASRQLNYIDHLEKAIVRIENKTYGICRVTGKLIDKARLRAVPHATLSIEAKQMMNK